jgi:TonB family protein
MGARVETVEPKKPAPASAADVAPKQIPKGVTNPSSLPSGAAAATGATGTSQPGALNPGGKETKDPGQQVRAQGPTFFDAGGFNLEDYAALVRERVRERWFIPSNLRNYQGNVTIVFYIGKDGQVYGVKAEMKSGNDSLDISALSAVFGSNPFPPLPKGFPLNRVGARLIFAYNERQ